MKSSIIAVALITLLLGGLVALHAAIDEGWFYILFVPYVLLFCAAAERIHSHFTWRKD